MKADELREKYLDFFESKGCVRRPSDVLVPRWDPSVLFTPAGMNQFKDHFLGRCKLDFTRATTCQKCLRTGDIDNVGRTPYHHTFFEMLGNFSFGDYFKPDAIRWSWEFLTSPKWLGLAPEKLSVTVYLDDEEAAGIWSRDIGLPPEKIARLGEDENFWPANAPSQGPDGVCGPCSEIYYHTPFGAVEIWNLVFTQFNRVGTPPNNLRPLPSKNIDTGMGLERTAAVLQGVESNFHIDILLPLVEAAGDVCDYKYLPGIADPHSIRPRLRRIADHVRACTFAIHENVVPGNKKQGYVIRRLLRRAVLDGRQISRREPFLYKLVPKVAEMMKSPYPELSSSIARVQGVIKEEEANFFATIDAGLNRIERFFQQMKKEGRGMVSGAEAAELYTTHGFPPEVFEAMAAERNLMFDWEGYRREMEQHGKDSGGGQKVELFQQTGPLDALAKAMHGSEFLGYSELEVQDSKVIGIIVDGHLCDKVDEIDHQHPITVVLDRTPFYGEMGGQVGDAGELLGDEFRFEVTDCLVERGFTLHRGHLRQGKLALGQQLVARVDAERRQGVRRAHSATHILHYALQKVLGKHAQQQGSKVDNDWLRFDFPNPTAPSHEEIERIETEVNRQILQSTPITSQKMPLTEARKLGAMMLFGEKYPDTVRVISMGEISKELCGGTHLENTGGIGLLKIIGEESIAAGTRRITAVTGLAGLDYVRQTEQALMAAAAVLKIPAKEVPERVAALAKEVRQFKKQGGAARTEGLSLDRLLAEAVDVDGTKVVVAEVQAAEAPALRNIIDQLRKSAAPVAVLIASPQEDGKVTLMAGLSRDLVQRGLDAVLWVRSAAALVGGSGGGRPDMAQAGGKDASKISDALQAARSSIRTMLAG